MRDGDGNVRQYAGDAGKLYEIVGTTWTDRSKTGGYVTAEEEVIEMVKWKNKLLTTNFSDFPQQVTLGGSQFSDLTTEFRAKHIGVVGNFVVFGNTFDTTNDTVSTRVRWSAAGDELDYTVSSTTASGFIDLKTGGRVQRIAGGEVGIIFSETSVHRMSFTGDIGSWFQFDETLPGLGCLSPGSVAQLGNAIYVWSEQGFHRITGGGTQAEAIGANKVDRFARGDLDSANRHRISSVIDPKANRVYWAYPGASNTNGRPNKIIVYDINLQDWSLIEEDVELIWRAGGASFTLDTLDSVSASLDSLPASLDSERWKGDSPQFAAFGTDFKHGFFDGIPMTAEIDTQEIEFFEGRRARVNGARPLVDGGTVQLRVITRNDQADTTTVGPSLTKNIDGLFRPDTNDRYHRFRVTMSDSWNNAIGIQVPKRELQQGASL